ncbi:hypothetical protein BRD56_11205 [Thermoplasmatales archaeon SW_10_69_26]|jgi:uncharacterized protein (UPF0179 family)|nr:MAG: hypothetical protein BRD56_11205 [Thermoplasmatales archaeon SW_10_69_26]
MSDFNLTQGSRYRVTSVRTREDNFEVEATFQGITSMGSVDAMVLETDDGKRLVPTHLVLKIDVLEQAGEDTFDDEDDAMYT